MKRASLATLATVTGLVLLLGFKSHSTDGTGGHVTTARSPAKQPTAASRVRPRRSHSPRTVVVRSVTGGIATTPYGPVQVQVSLRGNRITAVHPVQLPSDAQRSVQIADYAIPRLVQETLAAQSAHIDMVSGASFTSAGYERSLQSALDRAGA